MPTSHSSPKNRFNHQGRDTSFSKPYELSENHKLASRIFAAARKPMSTPKYAALLVVLALIFGLGSWGIIRGVGALVNNAQTSETIEDTKDDSLGGSNNSPELWSRRKNTGTPLVSFSPQDSHGIRHASMTLEKDLVASDMKISIPSVPFNGDYVVHVYTSPSHNNVKTLERDDRCDLFVRMDDLTSYVEGTPTSIEVSSWSSSIFSDDVLPDVWIPLVSYPSKNSFGEFSMINRSYRAGIYECGTTVHLDLMKIENASPVNWDGTEPFQGEGPAFIKINRTTPGDYIFTLDAPSTFKADVISRQDSSSLMFWEMEFDSVGESARDSFVHRGVTPETASGYIFVYPDRLRGYGIRWTLSQQIDTSASSVQ